MVIQFIPFKYHWVARSVFRGSIMVGTGFILINQVGEEIRSTIVRGHALSLQPLLNVTLVIAINNIVKALSDTIEAVIEGVQGNGEDESKN
ncbi:hypothetical protein G7062_06795 [Erysipelothrix sp. HDW6C]|uniref:hypothetical protein n=1 Tax=Erysipelothrix sp. HDW6C TaxID=2714930 RepID=UPI00140E5DB0|nr:hypothetical protein [Erysipelothrix sp. HDW6C]QIK70008.1 hypothetical protein G7062_06795 [Erysipelothrix sp. HDW6C]